MITIMASEVLPFDVSSIGDLNAGFGDVLFKCSLRHLATARLMFAALCVCRLFVRSRKH
jgi:hypothetical protein